MERQRERERVSERKRASEREERRGERRGGTTADAQPLSQLHSQRTEAGTAVNSSSTREHGGARLYRSPGPLPFSLTTFLWEYPVTSGVEKRRGAR